MPDKIWIATARALEESSWLREVLCPFCGKENVTTRHSDEMVVCVAPLCRAEFDVPPPPRVKAA